MVCALAVALGHSLQPAKAIAAVADREQLADPGAGCLVSAVVVG
jgi:hypothetical protein